MSALSNWEALKEAEHFRALDLADVMEAAIVSEISRQIAEVTQDIELNRGTVAQDVVVYIDGDMLDRELPIVARTLLEKNKRDYTPVERIMRGLLDKAIVDYAGARIANQAEECEHG